MLMQSKTRWSSPPPDLMVPSALVNVLANAILSGEQEKDAIVTRLGYVLGRNWRWIRRSLAAISKPSLGVLAPGAASGPLSSPRSGLR